MDSLQNFLEFRCRDATRKRKLDRSAYLCAVEEDLSYGETDCERDDLIARIGLRGTSVCLLVDFGGD